MVVKNKSKILKIKPGYNPNCSSGMWLLGHYIFTFLIGFLGVLISAVASYWIYKRHLEQEKKRHLLKIQSDKNES
ncbi:MAG: hypothetical protein JXA54_09275 [Candidatus Heimdallarchaeota archaeon]|nr:hypothetical protein [Candidatus Heimdallarchaeota archaeon]